MHINKHHLIVISGPTGIGKSIVAELLSAHYDAPIISADSRQMYRQLNIGTAKPDKKSLTNFQYHFINNLILPIPIMQGNMKERLSHY